MDTTRFPEDRTVAWVLNLDADFELAFGLGYTPTKSVQDATNRAANELIGTLTREGDIIVSDDSVTDAARGLPGRAFCPTPRASKILERAGALPEPHPSFEVLRRVNGRAFCQALGATLPDATFETELDVAMNKLSRAPAIGSAWRVKRSHGVAGRGQRVHRPGEDASFVRAWIADGVQIEPDVVIVRELGMHGMLSRDGTLAIGALVEQTCDGAGAWLSTRRASDSSRAPEMTAQIELVAHALTGAGYFGPFGIDAFEWEGGFQPRSEINARYSMGFAIGFSSRTP